MLLHSQVTCKAFVQVSLSCSGTGVGRVSVAATWKSVLAASNWPITTSTSNTGSSGASLGVVVFTASRTLPATPGNGCSFTVTQWTKTGMVKDPSAVLGPVLRTW